MRVLIAAPALAAALALVPSAPAKPIPLKGTVGPGYTIVLATAAGKRVTSLKAGTYAVTVTDRSAIHHFHLIGKGVNRQITTIAFRGKRTVVVTLKPGRVIYQCDPHASSMKASFMVRA